MTSSEVHECDAHHHCGLEEFPSAPDCGPCNDPLFRACGDVTPVPPDIVGLPPLAPEYAANLVVGRRYCHPRNFYNPAKSAVYPRYTICDWDEHAKMQIKIADRESKRSERIDTDAWQILNGLEQRMRNRQCSNTNKLSRRSYETSFWKEQLITENAAMNVSIDNLREIKRLMEKALAELRLPLEIAEECLLQREKRTAIDQCHDEVEKCLSKEILIIRRVMDMMKKYIEKATAQIRVCKCCMVACDIDIYDKNHSQTLDDRLHQLRNSSCGITFHHGIELTDNTIVDKPTWIKYSRENLLRSSRERERSDKLHSAMETFLRQSAIEVYATFNAVNHALAARIQETTDIKSKLQERLLKINNDIRDTDRKISLLQKAIIDKERPLKVAQTRLEERTRRLNVELTMDEPNKGLICEIKELHNTIRQLKDTLHQCELTMSRLVKVRQLLHNDIAVKENTIQIDTRCCHGRRRNMPVDPNVGHVVALSPCPDPCA